MTTFATFPDDYHYRLLEGAARQQISPHTGHENPPPCSPLVIVTKISFVTLAFDIRCPPAYPVTRDVTESVK